MNPIEFLSKNHFDALLECKFESARFFPKRWGQKNEAGVTVTQSLDKGDRVFDDSIGKMRRRHQDEWVDVQIGTVGLPMVKNSLCVLGGLRPVPTFRRSPKMHISEGDIYQRVAEIAARSFVRIENATFEQKNGQITYAISKMQAQKSAHDAWNNENSPIMLNGEEKIGGVRLSWMRIEKLVKQKSTFLELVDLATNLLGYPVLEKRSVVVLEDLYKVKSEAKDAFIEKIKETENTTFVSLLTGCKYDAKCNNLAADSYNGWGVFLKSMTMKAITNVCSLYGFLYVPVNKPELEFFRKGTGNATFLDGGLIYISQVIYGSSCNYDPYCIDCQMVQTTF